MALLKLIASIVVNPEQQIGPNSLAFVESLKDIESMRGLQGIKENIAKHLRHAMRQVERGAPSGFHNIIITGGPGRGKTQLAMKIGRAFVSMGFFKNIPDADTEITCKVDLRQYIRVMRLLRRNALQNEKKKSTLRVDMKRGNRISVCLTNACIQNAIFDGIQGLAADSKKVITDILNGKYDKNEEDLPSMELKSIENAVMDTQEPPPISGKCQVYSKGDIVASYVGQTAPKTTRALKACYGGVFILDEAYSLLNVSNGNDDKVCSFGLEALNTLNQYMSEHQGQQLVILCGYKDLIESLSNVQRGLFRRFTWFYDIKDYSTSELVDIFLQKIPRHLDSCIEKKDLHSIFEKYKFANQAGDMENLVLQSEVEFDNDDSNPKNLKVGHVRKALTSHKTKEETKDELPIGMYL